MLTGEERRLTSRHREESTEVFRGRHLHSVCFRVLASFQPPPILVKNHIMQEKWERCKPFGTVSSAIGEGG